MTPERRAAAAVAALKALDTDGRLSDLDLPYAEILRRPQAYLGAFGQLPPAVQAYLQRYYAEEEGIRTLAGGSLSAGLANSGALLGRALYAAERVAALVRGRSGSARAEQARQLLRRTARQSTHLPFIVRRWLHHAGARVQMRLGRHDLATLLRAQQFDARQLGFEYLEGLHQLHGCESVRRQASPPATFGQLLGVDFVQSGGTLRFLEANCNPLLMDARLALYEPGDDPWPKRFVGAALARGFRRMTVYGYRPFGIGHADALVAEGRRVGVHVEVVDDLFSSHAGHPRRWLIQNGIAGGVFVVRAKQFDVLFDRTILSKRLTRAVLEGGSSDWAESGMALPALLAPGQDLPGYRPDARYPNIVAKLDGLDRGAGVSFYKLPRLPEALAREADFFEAYHVPDPVASKLVRGETTALADGHERAWKIRSYALLTPEGMEYLSSIKVICGLRVPPALPDGLVERKSIYLATINEGGFYSAVTPAEDELYARATGAIGTTLLAWLKRKYAGDSVV